MALHLHAVLVKMCHMGLINLLSSHFVRCQVFGQHIQTYEAIEAGPLAILLVSRVET